jgi:hypothetical protein
MYARLVYCVVAAILFFLISSPWLYTFVNSILGKVFTVAVKGCPTIPGLFLHGFVFLVVIYALSYLKVIKEAFIGEEISLSVKLACDPRCRIDETCTPNGCMPRSGQTGIVYVNGMAQPYKGVGPPTPPMTQGVPKPMQMTQPTPSAAAAAPMAARVAVGVKPPVLMTI